MPCPGLRCTIAEIATISGAVHNDCCALRASTWVSRSRSRTRRTPLPPMLSSQRRRPAAIRQRVDVIPDVAKAALTSRGNVAAHLHAAQRLAEHRAEEADIEGTGGEGHETYGSKEPPGTSDDRANHDEHGAGHHTSDTPGRTGHECD